MLVCIEGIDGAGKSTLCKELLPAFRDRGYGVMLHTFPSTWGMPIGVVVQDFLRGKFGSLGSVSPWLRWMPFAIDRHSSLEDVRRSLGIYDVVLCDRYVPSNVAYQTANLPEDERLQLTDLIEAVEYDQFRMPVPDLTVILDVSAEEATQRLNKRGTPKDINEASLAFQDAVRQTYLSTRFRSGDIKKIDQSSLSPLRDVLEMVCQ